MNSSLFFIGSGPPRCHRSPVEDVVEKSQFIPFVTMRITNGFRFFPATQIYDTVVDVMWDGSTALHCFSDVWRWSFVIFSTHLLVLLKVANRRQLKTASHWFISLCTCEQPFKQATEWARNFSILVMAVTNLWKIYDHWPNWNMTCHLSYASQA